MQNILIETLPGRIGYQDLKNASVEDFIYKFVGGIGVIHVSRQFIKYDDIFWGEIKKTARAKGSSKEYQRILQIFVARVLIQKQPFLPFKRP